MSDFDFDELDKAVNGALATVSSDDTETPEAPQVQEASSEEAPVLASSDTASVASPAVAPAARRSSGRFMDMVHPSSDMRSDMRTRQSPAVVAPLETKSVDAPSDAPSSDVPDTQALDAPESAPDWQSPLESPFLPDAKVEKRPLGGSEPTGDLVTPSPNEETEPEEAAQPDEHTMPDPLDFMASQQPEPTQEEQVETPQENLEETHEVPADSLLVAEEKTESPVETESHIAALEEQPIGPTSITQQYQEHPSSTQASGAIYDTEAYHQPLAHPEKKRSSWWIVLWIFLLIVFGAGAGAAFYIYVLPTL